VFKGRGMGWRSMHGGEHVHVQANRNASASQGSTSPLYSLAAQGLKCRYF
jgi:hypothetical protein